MKRALPIALSLLLCHCGTEVGNGVAPEEPNTEKGTTAENSAPTSAPQQDSSGGSASMNQVFSSSFIAACASPFAESMEGTFQNSASTAAFLVTIGTDGKRTVTRVDGSTIHVISPAPNAGTYAIEPLSASPQVNCGAVTSQTLSDGSIERSVTLSNGVVVQWTLTDSKVVSIKLSGSGNVLEQWIKK